MTNAQKSFKYTSISLLHVQRELGRVHRVAGPWVRRCAKGTMKKKNRTNQLTIASVVIEQVERDRKNKMSTAYGHCISYEQSR